MKSLLSIFSLLLLFNSCSKENELEDISLSNANDIEVADYLSMTNIREESCNVIVFDLVVKSQNIPSGLNYSHFLIQDDFDRTRKTEEASNIYMDIECLNSMRFTLSLFNESRNVVSTPSYYNFSR